MNKLLISLTACAFGLALGSAAIAADPVHPLRNASPQSTQSDPQAAPSDEPANVAADKENKPDADDEAYSAELKNCDAMKGGEKKTCMDKAQGKHGKM